MKHTLFITLPLASVLAIACGDSEGPSSSSGTDGDTSAESAGESTEGESSDGETTNPAATSGDGTTTGDPTEDPTTDPTEGACDACDANASCVNDACVCDEGYDGDGLSCADINECNTNTDACDANASCSNTDGSYECSCDEGFEGDGFTCNGTLGYGEPCTLGNECASGLCIGEPYEHCSDYCEQAIANHCGALDLAGLCVPIENDQFACVGDLEFGNDPDDGILSAGDSLQRSLGNLTDADLFHLNLPAGNFAIWAQPDLDDDIQVEIYNGIGEAIGILNNEGDGGIEGANLNHGGGVAFAVVRNVGQTTGPYTIHADPN